MTSSPNKTEIRFVQVPHNNYLNAEWLVAYIEAEEHDGWKFVQVLPDVNGVFDTHAPNLLFRRVKNTQPEA